MALSRNFLLTVRREDMERNELVESTLDFLSLRKTCSNCWHGRDGDCALYSCDCATEVFRRKETPSRWTSYEEGEEQERLALSKPRLLVKEFAE